MGETSEFACGSASGVLRVSAKSRAAQWRVDFSKATQFSSGSKLGGNKFGAGAGAVRGVMLGAMDETGIFPIPLGPDAPDLDHPDDPLAWHAMEPMAPKSVRRRRRLDLIDGDPLTVDVHFRDSHLAVDAAEDVLHEYTLQATVDPDTLVVLHAEAQARTLPWPECPNALASAPRLSGEPVAGLRAKVQDGVNGFQMTVAGGLGPLPTECKVLHEFIPAEDVVPRVESVIRVRKELEVADREIRLGDSVAGDVDQRLRGIEPRDARASIGRYLDLYNRRRPHSSLDGRTPDQAYFVQESTLPIRMAA